MPKVAIHKLEPERMAEAYPLIRHLAWVEPAQWSAFGRHLADQGGGVLAAEVEGRQIYGVAAYLPVANLKHGSALRVEAIAAIEFGLASPIRKTLLAALDEVAKLKGCKVVMVTLDAKRMLSHGSKRRRNWESLGLTAEAIEFVHRFDGDD